ncbi:WD40-repeat-containing domain protein [Mycena leptocephala]|nr:WD40-repeat-containing domain protein [Mycena leptocephala]
MKIWDATTGSVLHTCRHSQDELVSAVAFSRRGDRVATGSYHRNIRIWDSETGQELVQPFLGHLGPVIAVAFAPDDKTIISGSLDHHVRIWSLANRRPPVPVQPSHTDHVSCVALANDRTHFASGSADNSLIVWDMDGNVSFSSSHGHSGDITSIDFSPNGKILASGSEDGTVCLWDIVTGQLLGSALQHPDKLVYVKFSTSGSTLATITRDHTLRVWCIPDGILSFESFPDLDRRCRVVTFSHDDSKIATFYNYMASTGLGMIIRDTGNGNILSERRIDSVVHGDELYSVKMEYTADEKYLVVWYALSISARDDFSIRAFDAVTGEEHICQVGYPDFPEFKMPIGINTQIRRNGRKVVELPSDLDYMARITCWDSKGEMIVVGSPSGDTYCITFHD